jgi:hypothetical protein
MASAACRRPSESLARERILVARCTSPEAANALRNELRRMRERCNRAGLKSWKTFLADPREDERAA